MHDIDKFNGNLCSNTSFALQPYMRHKLFKSLMAICVANTQVALQLYMSCIIIKSSMEIYMQNTQISLYVGILH